jgi:hypothetical protein
MKRLETFGWVVFVLSSVFFLVSGIIAADAWVIAGSSLFLIGVVALWVAFSNRS